MTLSEFVETLGTNEITWDLAQIALPQDLSEEESIKAMQLVKDKVDDPWPAHELADGILLSRLRALGESALCEVFESIEKWYA